MEKTIELAELTPQLQSVMAEVVAGHRPCLITESGQPKAVLIEYSEYLKLQPTKPQPRVAEADSEYVVESSLAWTGEKGERLPPTWSKADEQWFSEHYLEIHEKFAGKWVAVRDGKIAAWYSNVEKAWIVVDPDLAVTPEKCYHEFVFR